MAEFHDENPWRDRVVYVPIELLAATLETEGYPAEQVLAHWRTYGDTLDAYVLPQPTGRHSAGVRFGTRPDDYLSPGTIDEAAFRAIVDGANVARPKL